nr:hypothetical protein [Tanacetum cinerariifolium]
MQTQTSNTLHNAIMEAGSKDRPPMLAPGSPITTTERIYETYKNVSQDIRDQLNAEAEAVQIILTGIYNDIYSTVDACLNAYEMWKAIERLKQGESINVQDLKTNLYWEFGKFTSQDEWQRFVTLVKQSQELKTVSYHKLYDILKQHQHEVNEIRAEKIARVANPLALDKEIDKLMDLISLSFKKIYKPTNNNLRTSSTTSRANQDNSPRINRSAGEFRHVARECQKPKRAKDAAYHKEKMLLCKQEEAGIQLNAEQADWRDDTDDDELEDQELEAHYMYMEQLQEVSPDAADSGPIFDDEPLQKVQSQQHLEKHVEVVPYIYNALPVPDLPIHHHQCHIFNQLALHSTEFLLPSAYTATSFPCDKLHPLPFLDDVENDRLVVVEQQVQVD